MRADVPTDAGKNADVLSAAEESLRAQRLMLAMDAQRSLRNFGKSARLMAVVCLVAAAMGVAAWFFLTCLDAVTGFREGASHRLRALAGGERRHRVALPRVRQRRGAWQQPGDRLRSHRTQDSLVHGAIHLRMLGRNASGRQLCGPRGNGGADRRYHRGCCIAPIQAGAP